jgi:hypothetical protein
MGRPWGAPRSADAVLDELREHPGQLRSILVRIAGKGAGLLYGREAGKHRFHGIAAVDPCHVIVHRVAMRATPEEAEWSTAAVASPWPTEIPKGLVDREHADADEVRIFDEAFAVPWAEYGARIEEIALADLQVRFARDPGVELAALYATELGVQVDPDDSGEGA